MRLLLTTLCLLTVLPTLSAQFASDRNNNPGPAMQGGGPDPLVILSRDLMEARELLKRFPATGNRDKMELLLTRMELQLKQLAPRLASGERPRPMNLEDFNRFLNSLRGQAFDKDKIGFLENFMPGRFVTCDQAGTILKLFSFDNDRIRAAVYLHGFLTDPENFHQTLAVFTFDSSRKTVMERVRKK